MNRFVILLVGLAAPVLAQDWLVQPSFAFESRSSAQESPEYQKGLSQLDARQWDQAIASFSYAAAHDKVAADGALYWKAYAQNRSGRHEEALTTISALREKFPSSRWIKDARALELEIRAQSGAPVSPSAEPDDELKLLAVNGLMQSEPNRALPIVQHLLTGNNSEKIKEQALFVLSQNSSPEAGKLLDSIAGGTSNPDLQVNAIRYMGMMGNANARVALASLYKSSADLRIKRAILQSFVQSGSRDFLLNAAKSEQNPALRRDAIRQLALTGGQDELWQLYQSDRSVENRKTILESMFLSGNSNRLAEIAQTEGNPDLRVAAVKSLGLMGANGRGDALVRIYQSDKDPKVRAAVIDALFFQQNGKALVNLAKSEMNPELKREIIQKMALIQSKDVNDYMMEILR